jgi:hypothetical protein
VALAVADAIFGDFGMVVGKLCAFSRNAFNAVLEFWIVNVPSLGISMTTFGLSAKFALSMAAFSSRHR